MIDQQIMIFDLYVKIDLSLKQTIRKKAKTIWTYLSVRLFQFDVKLSDTTYSSRFLSRK